MYHIQFQNDIDLYQNNSKYIKKKNAQTSGFYSKFITKNHTKLKILIQTLDFQILKFSKFQQKLFMKIKTYVCISIQWPDNDESRKFEDSETQTQATRRRQRR